MVKISIKKEEKTIKPRQKQKQKQSQRVVVNIGNDVIKPRRKRAPRQALQKGKVINKQQTGPTQINVPQALPINQQQQSKDSINEFIKFELKFDTEEYQVLLKNKYGMPENISKNISNLIQKEKFENTWDFITPRSIEKAINQIGCDIETAYDTMLLPYLNDKIKSPMDITSLDIKKDDEIEYLTILKLIIKHQNATEQLKVKDRREVVTA